MVRLCCIFVLAGERIAAQEQMLQPKAQLQGLQHGTGGLIRGQIWVEGHPKVQETFARISGYVEQFDIHSPALTIRESFKFSAQMRLMDVTAEQLEEFVDEVRF